MDYITSAEKPLFAAEITNALKKKGIKAYDISNTFRRYEKKGRLYVRRYYTDWGRTRLSRSGSCLCHRLPE